MSLLGSEVFAVELERSRPDPAQGVTEDGAPKVHETNLGGQVELGFQPGTPWRHVEEL